MGTNKSTTMSCFSLPMTAGLISFSISAMVLKTCPHESELKACVGELKLRTYSRCRVSLIPGDIQEFPPHRMSYAGRDPPDGPQ